MILVVGFLVVPNKQPSNQQDSVWVMQNSPRPLLGRLNVQTELISWINSVSIPKNILTASTSYNGRYLALVSFAESPKVLIYLLKREKDDSMQLVLYEVLVGFSKAIWSPYSEEILLAKSYWDNPVIWKVKYKSFEAVTVARDICSIHWGNNSDQVLVSKCEDDRALVAWDRLKKRSSLLIRFNYKIGSDSAAFATLHAWSPDHRKLLIFTYASAEAFPEKVFEMPPILTGYWQVLDIVRVRGV